MTGAVFLFWRDLMGATSFFHGVTVSLVDSGPRTVAVPSSSIVGMVNTYTPGADLVSPNVPIQLTSYREAVAAFGQRDCTDCARDLRAEQGCDRRNGRCCRS
jgi:phage tail sheath protein FI